MLLLHLHFPEQPPPLTLLDDSGSHHLPLEPPQQHLLQLIVPDSHLHVIVPTLGVENVCPSQRREAGAGDPPFSVGTITSVEG